ncbi:MAG: GtrA family protein [Alistipes sp.]
MNIAGFFVRLIDRFYVWPATKLMPPPVFRYGVCGVWNMFLDLIFYYLIYHYLIDEQFIDLGVVVMSPHIASLVLVFPITFLNGFWLNRNVAFRHSPLRTRNQLFRYLLSVLGAIVVNYVCMKFFVEECSIWATPSKALTTAVSVVYSYFAARYFTFRGATE